MQTKARMWKTLSPKVTDTLRTAHHRFSDIVLCSPMMNFFLVVSLSFMYYKHVQFLKLQSLDLSSRFFSLRSRVCVFVRFASFPAFST